MSSNATANERLIVIQDIDNEIFNGCFDNPFIYDIGCCLPDDFAYQVIEISSITNKYDRDTAIKSLQRITEEKQSQAYYNFINKHLHVGEFIEVYTDRVNDANIYGPPLTESIIALHDLLLPINSISVRNSQYDECRHKCVIQKLT